MNKLIRIYRGSIYCIASVLLITACGGEGGGSKDDQTQSNPNFIAKAETLKFSRIQLYQGHIKDTDRQPIAELDTSSLNSGDLITIDVEFEITGELKEYSLVAQLVPQSIVSLLQPGTTIGEIFNKTAEPPQGESLVDLGGVYINQINPGLLHGVFHVKLPTLKQDTVYQIAVMPSLDYLSSGKPLNDTDIESVPVLLDERKLIVKKLSQVSVKLAQTPNLMVDNDFTEIEIGGGFDANGFSIEPIFQTSVKIDMTTFNDLEEVVLSLSWADPAGTSFPLGLLISSTDGTPVISTNPHITIKQTDLPSITVPVVAYTPIKTQSALVKEATYIRDIANQVVKNGEFELTVSYVDSGGVVAAGSTYRLFIPLVSQDSRPLVLAPNDVVKFDVLRAGNTNLACLSLLASATDIDTGLLAVDSTNAIVAVNCPVSPNSKMLWRYDVSTKQIIHKILDSNDDNYCIEVFGGDFFPNNYHLQKCRYKTESPGIPVDAQRFIFEGQKIRLEIAPIYLVVIFGSVPQQVGVESDVNVAPDFFTDLNGIDIDANGRLFYVGKFYDRHWGSADLAQASLSFGGESYLDYMPVIGATAEGHAIVSASLFGISADLLNSSFAIKRSLTKKLSVLGNNYPDKEVGNGAEFKVDVLGYSSINLGSIATTNVTETFNAVEVAQNILSSVPVIGEIKPEALALTYKMNEKFLETTFIVVVVPVTVEGGIEGNVDFNVALISPGAGLAVSVTDTFTLSSYIDAKVDALIVASGVVGTIDVINQKLTFSANQGFSTPGVNTLSFNMGASLDTELKLLKGEISAFVEYYTYDCCIPPWKKVKKDTVIYSSDYLFNKKWTIFDGNAVATVIEY